MNRALVLVALLGAAASGQMQFLPAVPHAVGDDPFGALLLDFTGDGQLDLVVSSDHPDKLEFLANLGGGEFDAPQPLATASDSNPMGMAAGDFDDDGLIDLVVAMFGQDALQLLRGTVTGGFALGPNSPVGAQPRHVVAADLNADGFLDAAVQNQDSGDASVLLNDGAGGFLPAVTHEVGVETRGIAAGDLTADGLPDLAVTSRDDLLIRVLGNLGDGSFDTLADLSMGSFLKPHGVVTVDVDHDDDLDLFVSATSNSPAFTVVSVFKNVGGTDLDGPVNGQCGGLQPAGIVAADFDLDGNADVAEACTDSNNVSTNKGDGYFFFFAPATFAVGLAPEELVAGDLDGNGSPDLVAVNVGNDSVSVLMNAHATVWTDLGHALPGTHGPPALLGTGQLLPDSKLTIELTNALQASTCYLVAGFSQLVAPFKGGVMVPQPDVIAALPTGAAGGLQLVAAWPVGVPGGTQLVLQGWIVDPAAVKGLAASNAVVGVAP